MTNKKTASQTNPPQTNDHSACGVGMIVHFASDGTPHNSHALVQEGLSTLASMAYRSGYNLATEESDGSGIRLYGLPTVFFNKLLNNGVFIGNRLTDVLLKEKHYAIGQFFLANETEHFNQAKQIIESCAAALKLRVIAWRNLADSINTDVLSVNARIKIPAIWQVIIVSNAAKPLPLDEPTLIEMGQCIHHKAYAQQLKLNIVSLSHEKIIYKGMIPAPLLSTVYQDLQDPDFTAYACDTHARFATNTRSQWSNAQPCPNFISHNGELNSAPGNAKQMASELNEHRFKGIYPDDTLSDSMQFDADLANQMTMKQIPLEEAMIRLMAPDPGDFAAEVKAMLKYWSLERTPYNGPAFMVAGCDGHFMAKLDSMGLRPSRWALAKTHQGHYHLYAASDDLIDPNEYAQITKGHLEPGGMILLTPEGKLLQTEEILERIAARYNQNHSDYFQQQIRNILQSQPANTTNEKYLKSPTGSDLERILYAAGWDYEAEDQVVRFMAENGCERTAAMGDDTNILYTHTLPPHSSYFFHQLFAQVSAPALDSIKERDRFSLNTFLGGGQVQDLHERKFIELKSPILESHTLSALENNPYINSQVIDISFFITPGQGPISVTQAHKLLSIEIERILLIIEAAVNERKITNIILSDRYLGPYRIAIPDLIAVAAVRKFLQSKHLDFSVSITMDSYQIHGPHQAATLFALGAKAIYPRGAYAKIQALFPENTDTYYQNYREALNKCLLKSMGKMGINDVNNYINSSLVAALGLDLSAKEASTNEYISLSTIFAKIYSPLKGLNLGHIAQGILLRHQQANNPAHEFTLLPRSGYYMPEKNGVKHGFGPEVINAFSTWMNEENLQATLYQMHLILHQKGHANFIADTLSFSEEYGFLDPRHKNSEGFYPNEYLERFKPSLAFKKLTQAIERYRRENPTALRDYFLIKSDCSPQINSEKQSLQSTQEIRSLLFAGNMSQGALTVSNPKTPDKLGAHETLTRGMNAIGAQSASGEGGEAPNDLDRPLTTTRSKQLASGRFGVSARQIIHAEEIEIKIAQGAKPGEGGELPGTKVSIRFAAQRGGLPHLSFISPPPHHDIYSIEDLEQLIHDIKSVKPTIKVAVKLVASVGIGTIAIGVTKAGADVINIAGNSGGTGAAQQSSIKHAGFPAELGLAEVDRALRQAELRDLVLLRASGGFKTAEDVLITAILGADLFEFGTTAMLTLGCKMQRTCNLSCQPGVATDGHLFKGDQINTERYFVNLAASIQEQLQTLGFHNLTEIRGRTDLLQVLDPESLGGYDFSVLLERNHLPLPLPEQRLTSIRAKIQRKLARPKEEQLIEIIKQVLKQQDEFTSEPIALTIADRSFGARLIGALTPYLQKNPQKKITINTTGNAGQSFGFVNSLILKHMGTVQDGCGKSMTGGELILCTPSLVDASQNTLAGNAMLYGARGGKIYVNGRAGHRFAILLKGAEVVVEGVGDFAFEYMTSGTGMILGRVGKGLGTGASGGIIIAYDPTDSLNPSNSVRLASAKELSAYQEAIKNLLAAHHTKTNSLIAAQIINNFNLNHFKVLIPNEMDNIQSWRQILDIMHSNRLSTIPFSSGMRVWLLQKIRNAPNPKEREWMEFNELLQDSTLQSFSIARQVAPQEPCMVNTATEHLIPLTHLTKKTHKKINPVEKRLETIQGTRDHILLQPLKNLRTYINALTQDAQGCSGCRAQSCSGGEKTESGCPGGKGINTINSLLKRIGSINEYGILTKSQWSYLRQAFAVQIEETPFIAYTGAACPAPCQDACTETIPNPGPANNARGGKPLGEYVHIKDIEYDLYQIGRALGWLDGKKTWSTEEVALIFGGGMSDGQEAKHDYDQVMQNFKPPFLISHYRAQTNKELIIIGSGPAAMQIAYRGLLDGLQVRMYEKSNHAGGLLADGIPAHKFDKTYLTEDFTYLQSMGLELHLNSEVYYDGNSGDYRIRNTHQTIANSGNEHQFIALCIGAGQPKHLTPTIISELAPEEHHKLVQAVDFLKAANEVATILAKTPSLSPDEKEQLIKKHLAHMDPRNKKIVVIGGGDTAQDVIRWVARYFNDGQNTLGALNILVRGPQPSKRAILDGYPMPSRAFTDENLLKMAEVEFVHGSELFLVEPVKIFSHAEQGKLTLKIKKSQFMHAKQIQKDLRLASLFDTLPRELKPIDEKRSQLKAIQDIDLIICALGFEGGNAHHLVSAIKQYHLKNVYVAGDAAGTSIIVSAQNSANKIYGLMRAAMALENNKEEEQQEHHLRTTAPWDGLL